jgi:hypothetical protein
VGDPTVRSDPYKAGLSRRPRRRTLWTSEQWRRLCERARDDTGTFDPEEYPISPACLDLIREFNRQLVSGLGG